MIAAISSRPPEEIPPYPLLPTASQGLEATQKSIAVLSQGKVMTSNRTIPASDPQ
jgi:hypothetical protein